MEGKGRSFQVAGVDTGKFGTSAQIIPDSYVDWIISRFIMELKKKKRHLF